MVFGTCIGWWVTYIDYAISNNERCNYSQYCVTRIAEVSCDSSQAPHVARQSSLTAANVTRPI